MLRTTASRWRPCCSQRSFSTSLARLSHGEPVSLAYDHYLAPSAAASNSPLVILHGLFGSKQNWRSLSRAIARKTGRDVYALDLRNHGDSPSSKGTTYKDYASDISDFFKRNQLKEPILIGHSMGGKVAMTQALVEPDSISKLMSIDMSPARGAISPEFAQYIVGMRKIHEANVKSKKEGDKILQDYEQSLPIRQFLLTNLVKKSDSPDYAVRLPLDILSDSIDDIGDFPFTPEDASGFHKPTLFVKGAQSKYVNRKNMPIAEQLFPNMRLEVVEGAGHWVHSEKPKEFVDLVSDFCR